MRKHLDEAWGNQLMASYAKHHAGSVEDCVVIALCDPWIIQPGRFPADLRLACWSPIDRGVDTEVHGGTVSAGFLKRATLRQRPGHQLRPMTGTAEGRKSALRTGFVCALGARAKGRVERRPRAP